MTFAETIKAENCHENQKLAAAHSQLKQAAVTGGGTRAEQGPDGVRPGVITPAKKKNKRMSRRCASSSSRALTCGTLCPGGREQEEPTLPHFLKMGEQAGAIHAAADIYPRCC